MPTESPFVSAIVLAAGESKRMGRPKLLLPLGGTSILERTVMNLVNSRVDEVIVVLGHQAEELSGKIPPAVRVVQNPRYRLGMSTSIAAGLEAVSGRAAAVMLALGDQPFTGPDVINRLLAGFHESGRGIAVPVFRGRRGHPVIFDIAYRDELMKLTGDTGGRHVIAGHPGDVLEVPVDSDSVNRDIDTPEDYDSRCPGDVVHGRFPG